MIHLAYIEQSKVLLERLVLVQKESFGFSIRNILPIPFLFKKIDYAYLWGESEELRHELRRLISEIEGNPLTLKRDEIFLRYLMALTESADALTILLKKLSQKSSNIIKYNKSEYLADLDEYEISQSKYSKLGVLLNEHLATKI